MDAAEYAGFIDIGILVAVCRELVSRYESVPLSGIVREYNARCPVCPVFHIHPRYLRIALELVPSAYIYTRRNGSVWGICRRRSYDG